MTSLEAAGGGPNRFAPPDVLLAVEIVSPSSRTFDRWAKPALYAEANIPFYWRIETENGIEVNTYKLGKRRRAYVETGCFVDVIDLAEPWPLRLPISQIRPRLFSPEKPSD